MIGRFTKIGAPGSAKSRGDIVFHVIATGEDYHADFGLWANAGKAEEIALAEAVRECGGYRIGYPGAHVVRVGAQGETSFGIELAPDHHADVRVRVVRRLVNP